MKTKRYGWVLMLPLLFFTATVMAQMDADNPAEDIVHLDDVIIDGSLCVGFDCTNGMNFGSDTQILKENNLRIFFDDTSSSASFPSNDWRLQANDSTNGGDEYFAIQDATSGRTVFRVDAGAISNALYVDSEGDVGIGTSNPVVEVHAVDGNTPTVRLEQNGSSGFTPQTWDLAGNETNFFIRDVTNGSALPFRIKPGADTDALFVAADNNIGLGTDSPSEALHVRRTDATATEIFIENANATAQSNIFRMQNTTGGWTLVSRSNGDFRMRNLDGSGNNTGNAFVVNDGTNNITTVGDITANGVMLTSDTRLKKNIQTFDEGMAVIKRLNPIKYNMNGEANFRQTRDYYSISAQELQKAAPYLVHTFTHEEEDNDGNVISTDEYLKYDLAGLTWTLVNAVKEKDQQLEELQARLDKIESLLFSQGTIDATIDGQKGMGFIGQNAPNPYNDQTNISYFIPADATSARIEFHDLTGKLLKKVSVNETGYGELKLSVNDLPSGQYTYTLIINEGPIDTKKMIITK